MPKGIEDIINEFEEIVENGTNIAFTTRVVVDSEVLMRIIEDLRLNVPEEVNKARAIVGDRAEILTAAKKEGERIIAKAREQAVGLIDESEIAKAAKVQAEELLSQAKANANMTVATAREKADAIIEEAKEYADETTAQADRWAKEMRTAASDFVEQIMRESDEVFTKGLNDIRRVRANLSAAGIKNKNEE